MPTSKIKTVYTKAERKSARFEISFSYYDATFKKRITAKPTMIKMEGLGEHDLNYLQSLIKAHAR
jgi:hypothetical protein